jgi:hypothetical protein
MQVPLEVYPYGSFVLEIYPAITDNQVKVFAIVRDNPFTPIVHATTEQARRFANAILEAADAGDRAARGITR